ncbi:ATP-binding protein [Cuniculiplasma sp. SKW3]|uniref:ATP-binding protein n=1 Tax=Cuniculiplasma sp. SKW3 TaxID=3400170 RepID=UPI003FD4AD90
MPFRYSIGSKSRDVDSYDKGSTIPQSRPLFHSLILGRTGTGKSNLIKNLILHLKEKDDTNFILVDFHGTLSAQVIDLCRDEELIYLSTKSVDGFGIRMNVLSGASTSPISMYLISQIFSSENSLSGGTWGPRLQTIFTAVLREIVRQNNESTLKDFLNTLIIKERMQELRENSSEETKPVISNLIKKWDSWIEYSMSTVNKLFPIVSDEEIANFISSKEESINLTYELSEGSKLIVIDVAKTKMSIQQGRIISSMILNKMWSDILKNGNSKETMIIVDEAQNLNSSLMSEILSEGRKFNLYLTLASQFLSQYDRTLRDSIISNCGNIYCFNMSEEDATDICSLVSDRKLRQNAIKSIMLGQIHKVTAIDLLSKGGIEVNEFYPPLIESPLDYELLNNAITGSLRKFGRRINEEKNESLSDYIDLHKTLIKNFREYLEKKSIRIIEEENLNGPRPDLIYFINGNPVIVEVEVSDLLRFERIVKKACTYSKSEIIFLCPPENGLKLFELFRDKDRVKRILQRIEESGQFTFFNPEKITILEERAGRYYYVQRGNLKRWAVEKSWIGNTKAFSLDYENSDFSCLALLRKMEAERKFHVSFNPQQTMDMKSSNKILAGEVYLTELYN